MNQADRTTRSFPARPPEMITTPISPISREVVEAPSIPSASRLRGASFRMIRRACRRHWWLGLLLWILGTSPLIAGAIAKLKPTYDASSILRIEPVIRSTGTETVLQGDFQVFKETQAHRITYSSVISKALTLHPELLKLPSLGRAHDPEDLIQRSIGARIIPGTNLLEVSMTSESADESASVVNAVIEAYLQIAKESANNGSDEPESRLRKLKEAQKVRAVVVRQKREALAELGKQIGTADTGQVRERNAVLAEQQGALTRQTAQTDLEQLETQARLDQLLREIKTHEAQEPPESNPNPKVVEAFYALPQVIELRGKLEKAREALAQAKNQGEAAKDLAQKNWDDLQGQLDALWIKRKPDLTRPEAKDLSLEADLKAAEGKAAVLKTRLAQLHDRLEKLETQIRLGGTNELALEFARQELVRAEAVLETLNKNLDQVELESRGPAVRFVLESKAKPSITPDLHHRTEVLAGLPLMMLVVVLGVLVLVEYHSSRVYDPEEMPDRLKLPVLGEIPPLPSRQIGKNRPSSRSATRLRRELDQFIQSLDHLRVALCSGRDIRGRNRRCILITSASSAEGKTTLAAQLAERCVNAGLLTLLIDGDIRNPSLSRMFELSVNRGLVNVLKGEVLAEEVISIIRGAGGFHFLPAGSPRMDPSRLFQDKRLAQLLASARESFDMVIIDSPPVLLVPDALTIGRWVDGAVMAVRFDKSRYPLVDRANRRLTSIGVPLIGAVICGVRPPLSNDYGSYDPSYGSIDEPPGDPTLRATAGEPRLV